MAQGSVGDRVILESEKTGRPAREGEILEVLDVGPDIHYRVRWEDGHESTFYPSVGSATFVHKKAKAGAS